MKSVFNKIKIEKEKPKEIEFPVLAEALVGGETFVVLLLSDKKSVQFLKGKKKPYRAYINIVGKSIGLGYYYTEEEANAQYKIARHNRIDDLYLKYKDKVDTRVWDAIRSDIWCA